MVFVKLKHSFGWRERERERESFKGMDKIRVGMRELQAEDKTKQN